jgi:hypothetical protein
MVDWLRLDWRIMTVGVIATILGIIAAFRSRTYRFVAALLVCMWMFLARGKLVIVFYIVPMLPLFALMAGMLISHPLEWLKRHRYSSAAYSALCVALLLSVYSTAPRTQWINDETTSQQQAVEWITSNLPQTAVIAMDDYAYPELRDDYNYVNADWVWKVEYDPAVSGKLHNDWRNIQYILLTHEVLKQVKSGGFPLVKQALLHAELVADFTSGTTSYLDIPNFVSTNGDWAQVYRVKSREAIIAQDAWSTQKASHIKSYGQVVNPQAPATTTLAQQVGFLDAALGQNDKNTYDGLLRWSRDHLQHRPEDQLLSASWTVDASDAGRPGDNRADLAANARLAASLLRAADQWKREDYRAAAHTLAADLWRQHAASVGGKMFLAVDPTAPTMPTLVSLSALRALAAADKSRPWAQIADNQYAVWQAQAATSPVLSPGVTLTSAGLLAGTSNDVIEQDLQLIAADLAREAQAAGDDRAKVLLRQLTTYFAAQPPTSALYHRDGAAASGASQGFASIATIASLAAVSSGGGTAYQRYLAPLYDVKTFTFRPAGNLDLQLAISDLLLRASQSHVSLAK